jgi:putative membrane protein
MGIYDKFIDLLHAISSLAKEFIKLFIGKSNFAGVRSSFKAINWRFGGLLLLGMLIAIALLANVIEVLLDNYPQYVFAVFFGLILASIPIPWYEMKARGAEHMVVIALVTLATFLILGTKPVSAMESPAPLLLFFGGVVAISGMVLPGVSGSFLLLLLGLYDHIISLVKQLTQLALSGEGVLELAVFLLGLLVGFLVFVRILKKALENYRSVLMAVLIGLMIGSLRVLWPFMFFSPGAAASEHAKLWPWHVPESELLVIVVLILVAAVVVFGLRKMSLGSR